jgi:hypothetical protein
LKQLRKLIAAWDRRLDALAESYGRGERNTSQFVRSFKGVLETDLQQRTQNSTFGKSIRGLKKATAYYFVALGLAFAALLTIFVIVYALGIPTWYYGF